MEKFSYERSIADSAGKRMPITVEVYDFEGGDWSAFIETDGAYYDIFERLTQREINEIECQINTEHRERLINLRYQFEEHI